MRRSEFLRAVEDEFGPRSGALLSDLLLPGLDRTSIQALDDGVPPRQIWLSLCDEADVPVHRRHGVGRLERSRR